MPSFYFSNTGEFAGNCETGATPPQGQGYTEDDPTPGMNSPWWHGALWQAGAAVPDASPGTNWDGLTATMLLNPEWQAATSVVRGINPGIVEALGAAMTQLSSGQYSQFQFLFSQICLIAEVTQAQREAWALIGEGFNMPSEFLAIVRGTVNGA